MRESQAEFNSYYKNLLIFHMFDCIFQKKSFPFQELNSAVSIHCLAVSSLGSSPTMTSDSITMSDTMFSLVTILLVLHSETLSIGCSSCSRVNSRNSISDTPSTRRTTASTTHLYTISARLKKKSTCLSETMTSLLIY